MLKITGKRIDEIMLQDFFNISRLTPFIIMSKYSNFKVQNLEGMVIRFVKDLNNMWSFLKKETKNKIKERIVYMVKEKTWQNKHWKKLLK